MGMVGGGKGAFIGAVHRMAAALDGEIELVCGAFSQDPSRSVESGRILGLDDNRIYGNYQQMFAREARLPKDEAMEFVVIVTPNHLHFPIACAALEAGFHVLCDKPATSKLSDAETLQDLIGQTGKLYGLTYSYSGYPMVEEARQRIASGQFGKIRRIMVQYAQGWLSKAVEKSGNKQAIWRLDPDQAGQSCCMGDIGTHAFHLAEYVSAMRVSEICADIGPSVADRVLDDDGTVLLRFTNGARGSLMASQICVGEENALKLQIYGEEGSLNWSQQEPNTLILKWHDRPHEIIRSGGVGLSRPAQAMCRLPAGHPEGYLEAFANIYRAFADGIRQFPERGELNFPGIDDGVRGMKFVETVVTSSSSDQKWFSLNSIKGEYK
ncbi:MAG: oxidoreductase [Alphaproteobacteria bacterium]|nr:MAG: oxidoreductase [Alphaproteobacteria bacterium]